MPRPMAAALAGSGTSSVEPAGTRTALRLSGCTAPLSVSSRTWASASVSPGLARRRRRRTAGLDTGHDEVGAGEAARVASSMPRPVAPRIHWSSSTADTTPPVAVTCTTGAASSGAMASSETTSRDSGGTETSRPCGRVDAARSVPSTSKETETALAPGLLTMMRSVRDGPLPPPTSHTSDDGSWHGVTARPRSSSPVCRHTWVATRPGARAAARPGDDDVGGARPRRRRPRPGRRSGPDPSTTVHRGAGRCPSRLPGAPATTPASGDGCRDRDGAPDVAQAGGAETLLAGAHERGGVDEHAGRLGQADAFARGRAAARSRSTRVAPTARPAATTATAAARTMPDTLLMCASSSVGCRRARP